MFLSGNHASELKKLTIDTDMVEQARNFLPVHGDTFLRCVDPNGCLVMAFNAELYRRGYELDELTRQKLMSPLLTNYDKNFTLLEYLQEHPSSCIEAFCRAAVDSQQQHVASLLLGNAGLILLMH